MSERPEQPEAPEAPEALEQTAQDAASLAAQLDALIQEQGLDAEHAAPDPSAFDQPADEPADPSADASVSAVEQPPDPAPQPESDPAQGIADDIPAAASAEPAPPTDPAGPSEPVPPAMAAAEQADEVPDEAPSATAAFTATPDESADDDELIKQIDQLLADQASQLDDALGSDAGPDALDRALSHEPGSTADEDLEGEFQSPQEILESAQSHEAQAASQAEQVAGDVAKPEPAAHAAAARPLVAPAEAPAEFGADASEVAAELDDQPEIQINAGRVTSAPAGESAAEPAADTVPHSVRRSGPALRLRRLCARLNRPLERIAPENRDLLGYISVFAFILPALGLITYALIT